ncbi:hypothetical protein DBR37_04935 [Herminiimonas sp. KBW02]|uniref:autotransporter domain-containing protein n=1 Tax=Herminiimonas sp. KBW02 TaxID=2153363 RepID=UPI000F595DA9|nr:autotransporter domain-containing protein [Herminiimonas sp. KBW02]RQO35722.1 hypothetical protein DBR37_04935 [Herminiimonas sp. KBW02]
MNKAYRIVWSRARSAFIVTHEKSSSRGRASTICAATILGVVALLLNATPVSAADLCTSSPTLINGATSGDNCVLGSGASVEVGANGSISSTGVAAIYTSSAINSITNHGSIASDTNIGISLDYASVAGDIRNTGTLTAVANGYNLSNGALYATGATISGSLINDGGQIGNTLTLRSSSVNSIRNINGGSIDVSGQQVAGINLDRTTIANGILNDVGSTIRAANYRAINMYGGSILAGGIVNNGDIFQGGITLNSNATVAGGIINTGRIEDIGTVAIGVYSGSILSGGIHNTGSILSLNTGVLIDYRGTVNGGLNNEAMLRGTDKGIFLNETGILRDGLTNSGTIAGTNFYGIQAAANSEIGGGIRNSGTIEGQRTAIRLEGASSLGADTHGVALHNSGTIRANARYVWDNSGLHLLTGSTINGDIVNTASGKIDGNFGINVAGASQINGNIVNSGIISGHVYSVYVSDDSTLGGLGAHGSSAAYVGDVYAKNSDFTVASGASFSLGNAMNLQGFSVAADGLFKMSEGNSSSGMLASGITVGSNGFSNAGTVQLASGVTATIHGSYSQSTTGVLRVGVGSDTSYGKLVVDGTANLASNAKIDVDVSPRDYSFSVDRLQNILRATTLNSDGTFAVTDNSILFDFSAVKDGNAVHLTLAKAPVTVLASVREANNTPALGAAGVLDQVITAHPGGAIGSHFVGLTSKQAVSDAVTQTLPLLNGGSMAAATGSITSINRVVQARIENNRGLSSGDDVIGDKYVWFKPFGSWARQDDRDGQSGFKANSTGFVAGADMAVNERSRLGAGFAYAKSKVDGNSAIAPQHMDVDVFQLLGYGSYTLDENTELNFQADIGQNSNKGSRRIAFTGSTASADYKSLTAHVGLGIGRVLPLNAHTSFTPSVRADYTWIKDQSYQESGAGALNLNVAGRSANELLLAADGKLAHKLNDKTTFLVNLGAAYTAVKGNTAIIAAFAGAPQAAFATYGMEQRPWTVRGGLGLVRKTGNNTEIAVRYDAEARNGFTNQTASVKARWAF